MRTQDARLIHINDYLRAIGAKKAREQLGTHGHEWVWHSPGRDDTKPSLCVNVAKNIWSDVPMGVGGRLIELVNHVNGRHLGDVRGALRELDRIFPHMRGAAKGEDLRNVTPAPLYRPQTSAASTRATGLKKKSSSLQLVGVKPLFHYALKDYISKQRGIPLDLASKYLEEVEYRVESGAHLFALGFKAGESYALRSRRFKGFLSSGVDIRIFDQKSAELAIFEGSIDFLSWLAAKKTLEAPHSAIVLNSLALLQRAIEWIETHPEVKTLRVFRDRDELHGGDSGLKMFETLKTHFSTHEVIDVSESYPLHKDLNAWWTAKIAP
ncbi:MAG: toprim domain-containing protein [Gammaproteobacteria bacterium]|nr:toprim domain-containing protein [Gammaproteobacteria bacterium]